MEDPFKYVQPQDTKKPQPINVPSEDPLPHPHSSLQQQAKTKKIVLIVIVAIVLILAIGAISLVFLAGEDDPQPAPQTSETPSTEPATPTPQITKETESHSSPQFSLSFAHPTDWVIEEVNGSDELTLTSPQLNLPGATADTRGIIQMQIRKPKAKLEEFEVGNAVAAVPSQKITYTNPSSAQRGDTYVSYLGFADGTAGLIDGVYITGDFGYKQEQAIPKVDIQKIDPIISVRFYACDGQCTEPTGVGRDLPDSEAGVAILDILKSLKIN